MTNAQSKMIGVETKFEMAAAYEQLWTCWVCFDHGHGPQCAAELALMRDWNCNQCVNCRRGDFADGSVLCHSCNDWARANASKIHKVPCAGGCTRVGCFADLCRFCEAAQKEECINPWADQEPGLGCIGCGAEGYDNDYCSRECMEQ